MHICMTARACRLWQAPQYSTQRDAPQYRPHAAFLSDLRIRGFSRDPATRTCSPWPLLPMHTSPPLVAGLLRALSAAMHDSLVQRRLVYFEGGSLDTQASTQVCMGMGLFLGGRGCSMSGSSEA